MGDLASLSRLVDVTLEKLGRIDLLVNNAGVSPKERTDILKVGAVRGKCPLLSRRFPKTEKPFAVSKWLFDLKKMYRVSPKALGEAE